MSLLVDIGKKLGNLNLKVKFETDCNFTTLFGLSGSGKSVTLKCIAGVMTPDYGRIELNGRVLFDSEKNINIKPQKRNIGYLPQHYGLFPNMTVKDNILTGLKAVPKKEHQSVVDDYLYRFGLKDAEDLYPHQISGGQQQRTALARAMATQPEILLLDEPFSALDKQLKAQLELDLLDTLKAYNGDVLFVSHSSDEVFRLSENVCVFDNGVCNITRPTKAIFDCPISRTEAVLLGIENISGCKQISDDVYQTEFGFDINVTGKEFRSIAFKSDSIKICEKADICFSVSVKHIINDISGTYLILELNKGAKPVKMYVDSSNYKVCDKLMVGLDYKDILYLM